MAANDTLYLGADEWLSGVLLFVTGTIAPSSSYLLQQYDGDTWRDLPLEESIEQQADGVVLHRGSAYWGTSPWKWNLFSVTDSDPESASADPPDDTARYWIRLIVLSGPDIVLNRILPQLYNTYTNVSEIADFMAVDIDAIAPPKMDTVKKFIRAQEDWVDSFTRRTFRPRIRYNENKGFNPYGVKLDEYKPWFVLSAGLWNGTSFQTLNEGRGKDFYLDLPTGLLYFTIPSFRLRNSSWLFSRQLRMPGSLEVTYAYGEDFETSERRDLVADIVKRLVAAELVLQSDWTTLLSSGLETVPKSEKIREYTELAKERAEEIRRLGLV